jgi:hypothetical protein
MMENWVGRGGLWVEEKGMEIRGGKWVVVGWLFVDGIVAVCDSMVYRDMETMR